MTDDLDLRAQARIGHVLNDKWRLERLLGVGGMAAVYAARHRNGAKAAVKVLHAELGADPDVKQRFLHEGYAANKVEHPNAVQVLDDDQVTSGAPGDAGTAYLVMELLDGESLLEHARNLGKALPDEEVLTIADQVLDVLDAAHKHGIVHRDLKPENLFLVKAITTDSFPAAGLSAMLAPPIRVKVLDFGIARIADGGGKTRVGTALGTPTYMAPEQASGRRDEIDGRTDLFALGATMWRLLTGKRIHDAPSSAEILAKMATVPAPAILSVAPHVSPHLAQIIDCSLRFRMGDRYPDAKTMRDDVRAVIEGRPPPYASTYAAASELRTAAAIPAAHGPGSFSAGGMEATGLPPVAELPTAAARPARPITEAAAPVAAPPAAPSGELPRTNDHASDAAALAPQVAPAPMTAPMMPVSPAPRKRTGLLVGAALIVFVGLGVGAVLMLTPSSKSATTNGANASAKTTEDKASADDEGDDEDDEPASTEKKEPKTNPSAAGDDDPGDDDDEPPTGSSDDTSGSHGNSTSVPIAPTTKPTTKPTSPKTTPTTKPTTTTKPNGTSTTAPPTTTQTQAPPPPPPVLTVAPTTTTTAPPVPPPTGQGPGQKKGNGKGKGETK